MNILQLEDIEQRLREKYHQQVQNFPQHFKGLIPAAAPASQADDVAAAVAKISGNAIPLQFRNILGKWDLGNLVLAGFRFSIDTRYAEALTHMNSGNGAEWWADLEQDARPNNLVMIAQSDPYILLLNLENDQVMAFSAATGSANSRKVASDSYVLLRALGTAELLSHSAPDIKDFARTLASASGGESFEQFWLDQVNHWAQYD